MEGSRDEEYDGDDLQKTGSGPQESQHNRRHDRAGSIRSGLSPANRFQNLFPMPQSRAMGNHAVVGCCHDLDHGPRSRSQLLDLIKYVSSGSPTFPVLGLWRKGI